MNDKNSDERWMRRCLDLARCGRYGAPPNPMVGAVIVCNGRIIGEGYHRRCGEAHAEVNAVNSVRPADRPLLRHSTIYVSLEPCAHFGRTPPCAELIARLGIPHVVVGCVDPFARVQGRGIAMLREAGCDVTVGVLDAECRELNRRFFVFHTHHRPYITLKWAQSSDGFIDRQRSGGMPARLSSPRSLMEVHRLRAQHGAILVGHTTLRLDHPRLDVRCWPGASPRRLVLGHVSPDELPGGFEAFADRSELLDTLYRDGVQSLLVEGGAQTLASFLADGVWDEARVEVTGTALGDGVAAPVVPCGHPVHTERHFGSLILHYRNKAAADLDE